MGSRISVYKQAARRTGCASVEEWLAKREQGLNWCVRCKAWLHRDVFHADKSRLYGLQQYCKPCAKIRGAACRYKLSESDAVRLTTADCCEICGRSGVKFEIDHDHVTGFVRGVLCSRCNGALGQFLDSEEMLLKAVQYLRLKQERSVGHG